MRVDSGGRSGDVTQSNSVDSDATALNINLTKQDADQDQWGRKDCGCHRTGIQAIGQEAKNEQGAFAGSLAVQAFKRGKCGCPSGTLEHARGRRQLRLRRLGLAVEQRRL